LRPGAPVAGGARGRHERDHVVSGHARMRPRCAPSPHTARFSRRRCYNQIADALALRYRPLRGNFTWRTPELQVGRVRTRSPKPTPRPLPPSRRAGRHGCTDRAGALRPSLPAGPRPHTRDATALRSSKRPRRRPEVAETHDERCDAQGDTR
jgi:hypothetical protein